MTPRHAALWRALLRDALPGLLNDIRIIGATARAPGLPFIASKALDGALVQALQEALDHAVAADAQRARGLRLTGFERLPPDAYDAIARFEQDIAAHGYAGLA